MEQPVIIVTGASRGLGAATATILALRGARVVLAARSTRLLQDLVARFVESGSPAIALTADVSRPQEGRRIVQETLDLFGRIDGVIHNAGVLEPIARLADADPEEWARCWQVNVQGIVNLTQASLPALRASRGRVVSVSTGASIRPMVGWSAYCTSKAGVNMLTQVLTREEPEVTFLAVRPGMVDTDMQERIRREGAGGMTPGAHEHFLEVHQAGGLLSPAEPGRALAALVTHAPPAWSGRLLAWDDEDVQELVRSLPSA